MRIIFLHVGLNREPLCITKCMMSRARFPSKAWLNS
jgi:hypothetical protein